MKKRSMKLIGWILLIILCISTIPITAMATSIDVAIDTDALKKEMIESVTDTIVPEPRPVPSAQPAPELTESELSEPTPSTELPDVQPELTKVVAQPLVSVTFHYYDPSQGSEAVVSSHAYHALALENGESITIAANKFPAQVPVSVEAGRFRVSADGVDVTAQAGYNAEAGIITLPAGYMGHQIAIDWYCPNTEITEIPVKVTVCTKTQGEFVTAVSDLTLLSNANSITVPLVESGGLVVSQNGIDLDENSYSMENGNLTITASPLGGDISVSAYAPAAKKGRSTNFTQVVHTRSADQIYYGYYTSYYTANGNVAFCLNPNVSGLSAGTYDVSGFLKRGEHDLLIKCAYYLYGGPGYDSVKNNLFGDPDSLETYGLCHAAASYVYLNDPSAFKGLSSAVINHLQLVIAAVDAQPMPPDGFDVFLYNVGSTTNQGLMSWKYTPTGSLEIQKKSSNPALTNNNPCYSLAGAVFDVFNSADQKLGTITTDANGKGRLDGLAVGSGYYIVETTPPKGFALESGRISFEIISGQTSSVVVVDKAQNDPVDILLRKLDADTNSSKPQGSLGLMDARFTIKYYKGMYATAEQLKGIAAERTWVVKTDEDGYSLLHLDYVVSGDPLYYMADGKTPTLPLGTITLQETKPPSGYLNNDELFIRQITSTGNIEAVKTYNEPIVKESVIRGGLSIQKWDNELNRPEQPQGDASLAGAVFEIYNRTGGDVVVGSKTYKPDQVVHTMTTDATGTATTAKDLLPYGKYEVVEKTPPTGYLGIGDLKQVFEIKNDGVIVSMKTSATAIKNKIICGGVQIDKLDIEWNQFGHTQGDATLAGAVLEIWNRSKNSVIIGGKEYAPNTVVYTMITDQRGTVNTSHDLLPYGSYEIIEKTPPAGYQNTGKIKQSFQIKQNLYIVPLGVGKNTRSSRSVDTTIKNDVIRGGVRVEKWDNEVDKHKPQGGATLEGTTFEIVNRSEGGVIVQNKLYIVGAVVYKMNTDETGSAVTPSDLLPYGTYEVRETAPPEGYLHTGVISRMFTIREHGKIVELNTSDTAIKNNPIRGDLKGIKISDGDANRLAGVPFKITSKTTGESHTLVTDKNGEFSTASSWNPHSQNTNQGKTDRDGIWFGEIGTLNDGLGALLYDTYMLEEQPCKANEDKELLTFEVSIYRHMTTVDLGTLTDDYVKKPEIFTTAMDKETMGNDAHASDETTILDTVYYSGLKVGKTYTIKGVLMDADTAAPLLIDGKEVIAEKTFRALSETGSVAMEFTFNSSALQGKSIVVFESLEFEGNVIAAHADIADEGQTVTFREPKVGTTATGEDGRKLLEAAPEMVIVDTVSYENLIVGQEYTLKGVLMDKDAGEPLMMDGEPISAERTFVAKESAGNVEMRFTLNTAFLQGNDIVVFESLLYKEREIAVHANLDDEGQTVRVKVPEISTSAADVSGGKELDIAAKVVLVDTLSYKDLAVGKTYTAKGILMDKAANAPLLIDGKEITAQTEFTPQETSGKVEVVFAFDVRGLAGKEMVVFESVLLGDMEIANHKDINDAYQTVKIKMPKIGTSAAGTEGSKLIPVSETEKIIDTVSYENLAVGEEYTLRGVLMDKMTGKPVLVDGKEITAETKFIAKAESGSVEVVFTFNSTSLQEMTLVVFETLEYEGKEIAAHADINDEAQTVTIDVKKPPVPPSPGAKTGRDGLPYWLLIVAIGAGVAAVCVCIKRKKAGKER